MPTLYIVSLSRHVRGHVKGPVRAVPAMYAGHWREEERDIMRPDMSAVRACLPACYRAAFDRTNQSAWFPTDSSDRPAHMSLYSSRGRYLNTVYFQPYAFKPESAS